MPSVWMGPSGGCTTRPVCTSCAQGVGGVYHGPYSPTLREWACPLAGEPTPHPASRTRGLRRLMRGATTISRTRGCATGAVSGRTPLPFFWSCTHLFHHPDQADHPCGPPRQAPPPPPPTPPRAGAHLTVSFDRRASARAILFFLLRHTTSTRASMRGRPTGESVGEDGVIQRISA